MSIAENLLYPPKTVYITPLTEKKDFNILILWMLNNNEWCEWSHFISEPVKISQSTLSQKLTLLKNRGLIVKETKEIDGIASTFIF